MGGDGLYIWTAYGIAFLLLISAGFYVRQQLRQAQKTYDALKALSRDDPPDDSLS